MTNAYVIVTGEPACEADADIAGRYLVSVSDEAPRDLVEETALEVFHAKIGIEELDAFSISVVDESDEPFPNQTVGSEVRDRHPLESWGTFEGSVTGPAASAPAP